jgi:hypothetical protein
VIDDREPAVPKVVDSIQHLSCFKWEVSMLSVNCVMTIIPFIVELLASLLGRKLREVATPDELWITAN